MPLSAIAAFPGSTKPSIVTMPEPREPGPGEVLCRTLELGGLRNRSGDIAFGQPLGAAERNVFGPGA